jgi:hypothetical protein
MNRNLGNIKELDLRDTFKDEARDLTPWLAREENLSRLSEEIGVEIKLLEIEANVGRFNVDILAEEESTGKKVIIENQLEITDHDHLGKLITYAAGHEAGIIIWIFREMREEHRQAIEWLNEHSDQDVDFFAIKLQLWQIDDSRPAAKFEIVVSPNEWAKTIRNKSTLDVSDTKILQLEFWTSFKEWMQQNDKKTKLRTPRPQHWYDVSMGSSEFHLVLTSNTREQLLGCELYITSNKEIFEKLKHQKQKVEESIGLELEWIDSGKASRIKATKSSVDIQDKNSFQEQFKWMREMILKFKEVFGPLLVAVKA